MDTTNTCTPTKDEIDDVLSILTPEMKKTLFPVHDDDSGIGMEFKKVFLSQLFESLFNHICEIFLPDSFLFTLFSCIYFTLYFFQFSNLIILGHFQWYISLLFRVGTCM